MDTPGTVTSAEAQLVRGLRLGDCVLLVVGSMIGSGIFLTTGQIADTLASPPLILLAWVLGGAMALCGAFTYAELGAMLPRAGGHYVYLREAYGPLVGFLDGWLSFVASFPGSIAFVALGITAHLPAAWSGTELAAFSLTGLTWTLRSGHVVAIGVILALSAINALGLRLGSGTQNLLTALKIAVLAGVAGLGLALGRGQWANLGVGADGWAGFSGMGAALIGVSFAYLGWDAATYMAAEVNHPERTLPRSLALGTLLVVGIYLLFNVFVLYALPVTELAAAGNPAGKAISRLISPSAGIILAPAILICILGSLNATVMVGPRIYYAMARDGLFPASLGAVSPATRVPVNAIAAQAVWSCIIVLSATLGRILAFTVLVIWVLSAVTAAAVFVLRRKCPEFPRPYSAWGYPWVPAAFCLTSLALAANHLARTPADALWLAGFLVAGLVVYTPFRRSSGITIGA